MDEKCDEENVETRDNDGAQKMYLYAKSASVKVKENRWGSEVKLKIIQWWVGLV